MSSERLESIEDELKAFLDQVQGSISYQLPTKVGGMEIRVELAAYRTSILVDHCQTRLCGVTFSRRCLAFLEGYFVSLPTRR